MYSVQQVCKCKNSIFFSSSFSSSLIVFYDESELFKKVLILQIQKYKKTKNLILEYHVKMTFFLLIWQWQWFYRITISATG